VPYDRLLFEPVPALPYRSSRDPNSGEEDVRDELEEPVISAARSLAESASD
jgi:hypothetical protein